MCKSSCFMGFVVSYHVEYYKAELAFPPIVIYTVKEISSRFQQKVWDPAEMTNIHSLVKSLFLNDLILGYHWQLTCKISKDLENWQLQPEFYYRFSLGRRC